MSKVKFIEVSILRSCFKISFISTGNSPFVQLCQERDERLYARRKIGTVLIKVIPVFTVFTKATILREKEFHHAA